MRYSTPWFHPDVCSSARYTRESPDTWLSPLSGLRNSTGVGQHDVLPCDVRIAKSDGRACNHCVSVSRAAAHTAGRALRILFCHMHVNHACDLRCMVDST